MYDKEKLEEMLASALAELKETKAQLAAAKSTPSTVGAQVTVPEDQCSLPTNLRTHTCGELRLAKAGQKVTLIGWVQTCRDMNHFAFVDLRDRYGITQCVFQNPGADGDAAALQRYELARKLGREFVITVSGTVVERSNKNKKRSTGEIEINVEKVELLNESKVPPFTIEDQTDGKEEIKMKYRYLDIRRNPVKEALLLRARVASSVRNFLTSQKFCEIETPVLIKSTPEGARDFVVPSRMNPGQWYALPQSPQTFKQILMVAGMDRYFQIVKCFRDEELRADRQPEFTQIDCEMAFVTQEDVLNMFEGMIRGIFKEVVNYEFPTFERITYDQAMEDYGIDKPDLRFDMKLKDITDLVQGKDFKVFDDSAAVIGICCPGIASWSNKKVKELEKLAKSQQIGGPGLVWVKFNSLKEGAVKIASSVGKFFDEAALLEWAKRADAKDGDLMLVCWGETKFKTQDTMGKLRAEMGTQLGLRDKGFRALWVTDFPMLEYDEEEKRWTAMHHPFTSPKEEDLKYMDTDPGKVRANAYDCVVNGVEMGGGSIRIHDKALQEKVFSLLGFTKEAAQEQFGFLMGAFEYGAPPHGGLAFGFDRMCTLLGGAKSIRDYIAFPKNNMGRDTMINSPSEIDPKQKKELCVENIKTAAPAAAEEKK